MQSQDPGLAKSGPDRGTHGDHLDADVLTAFAEQALSGAERERVLLHLAACAACRDVVSLAVPEPVAVEVAAPAAHWWFRWPVLRWTAVAASVIVVGAAVSVLVQPKRGVDVAVPASQPATAAKQPSAAIEDNNGPPQERREAAQAKKPAREVEGNQRKQIAAAQNDLKPQSTPTFQGARDLAAGAPALAKPAESEMAEAKTKAFDYETAKKETARKDAQNAEVTTQNGLVVGGVVGKLDRPVVKDNVARAAAPPPLPAAANESVTVAPLQQVPARAAAAPMVLSKSRATLIVRWRISDKGAVERSTDGKTWEKVEVDPGVTFRAISSNDGDLWVGGTGGALFHSADSGRTWSRVKVGMEGMWVADAITSVSFINPLSGTVMTQSGALWTTQDSGRSWQRRQ